MLRKVVTFKLWIWEAMEGERKRVLLVIIEGSVRGTMEEERRERRQLFLT